MNDRLVELQFDESTPQRLDKFLVSRLPEFSRARLQALIKDGFVTINDRESQKSGQILDKPSIIRFTSHPSNPVGWCPKRSLWTLSLRTMICSW